MIIDLHSRTVLRILAATICCLVACHVAIQALVFALDDDYLHGIGMLFDLDEEANLPTLFAVLTVLLAAAITASIARFETVESSRRPYWSGLAIIFLVMAVDEAASLHEIVGNLIDTRFVSSGYFFYSWIIPYFVLLVVLFVLYLRFFLHLPLKLRVMMIAAGLIFALGALGLESLAAHHDELYGQDDPTYIAMATLEEVFEMIGMTMFIYALLSYVELEHGRLRITIGLSPSGQA